ncbi:MAG TPA: zinc ribbon domain-containing protein [Pseudacidobacterium sp.]|nr:zinc ribbon domain-containing protein [Pseudacidobacterium sp.]
MDPVCHRCGNSLSSSEIFCPHCGAPQLRFEPSDEQPVQRPQTVGAPFRIIQRVEWRATVQAALMLALPVGLLSSLWDFGILWMLAGGLCTVALYRKRTMNTVNAGIGWRIGMLTGLLSAYCASLIDGLGMVLERYGLHHGARIDQRLAAMTQQMTEQMARQNPDAAQQIPWFLHFWLSPDGHAAMVLLMSSFAAVMMIAFSAIGGVLGARIFGARHRLSTNL